MALSRVSTRPHIESRPDPERIEEMLAGALAAEAGEPPSAIHAAEASRMLTDHSFRLLHNQVDEIRREAVAEHLSKLRPPPGFGTIFLACVAALIVAACLGLFLIARPDMQAHLIAIFGG
jgi:hypothetical protein